MKTDLNALTAAALLEDDKPGRVVACADAIAPVDWHCSRPVNHDGPCAAHHVPSHHKAVASLVKWTDRLAWFVVVSGIALFGYHAARHFGAFA